ncbi:MAG: hypothetical protein R3D84_05745 [Paracoccaceae bacterium]
MPIPLEFTLGAETYSVTQSGTALRTAELLNLWAWFVAHPSQAEIKGDFEAMKNAIAAALPLWDKIAMTGELQKVTVDTTFGSGAAESLEIELELSGLVAEGLFREKIAVTGLALPAEVFPPWVPPLLPADVSIDVAVDGFDLAAPARILLDELTPDSKPDPSQEERLLKALLPDGAVRITLAPGGAERSDHAVNWEGTMTAGPGLLPVGSGVLVVRGMDAILTALNAAPADVSQGAVPALLMARGLAKPEDGDRLVWQFESDGQGKVTVNGLDLSGLAAQ